MNMTKTMLALVGAAALATGAFADGPSITLNRVQQRYPWNGLVDIDYTVANVANPDEYYVQFSVVTNDAAPAIVMSEFLNSSTLTSASNGSFRVTWDSQCSADPRLFFAKGTTVKADLVYSPDDKSSAPYPQYVVIDISGGTNAVTYPVKTEYLCTAEACARYNTDEYKTNNIVLRRIKAPRVFTMGSPLDEIGREAQGGQHRETEHQVTLTQDYLIGVFELTQMQYINVVGSNPSVYNEELNPEWATSPVDKVTFTEMRGYYARDEKLTNRSVTAASFFGKLRDKTGNRFLFDLPTEAQWECACRAGTQMSTYFGNNVSIDILRENAWVNLSGAAVRTYGVGQKMPNPWGLYDMLGNILETCIDAVPAASASEKDNLGSDPVVDPLRNTGSGAVARGGCFTLLKDYARCAARFGQAPRGPSSRSSYCGYRISCTLP